MLYKVFALLSPKPISRSSRTWLIYQKFLPSVYIFLLAPFFFPASMASEKVDSSSTTEHHEKSDILKIDRGNEAILLRLDTEGGLDPSVKLAKDGHASRS
jgi:hypothetical protein